MGEPVLIYGKSGSGKSRSLKNFAEDEIYYVNVGDKSLPFRKKFKYTTVSDNTALIRAGLQKMPTKTADNTPIDKAIEAVIAKYPSFCSAKSEAPKGITTGVNFGNNGGSQMSGVERRFYEKNPDLRKTT